MNRRVLCAGIAAGLVPLGLAWRMAPLHLAPLAYKYGGSVLWAAMVYWIVAALLPRVRPGWVAVLAGFVAAMVELSRLVHAPGMDAFRVTLAGKLILGRFFSGWDIVAYWVAIALAAGVDSWWIRSTSERLGRPSEEPAQRTGFAHCSGHLLH